MNLEEILKQKAYLGHVESELSDLIDGGVTVGNRKVVRAVIRDELVHVRQAIFERNAYWENSEKLKELERRFANFVYGEIDAQILFDILHLYAQGGMA